MNILILGANGFIGSVVAARLLRDGHRVTGLGRQPERARLRQPQIDWVKADLAKMADPKDWLTLLDKQDVVVNCAGALQDGFADDVSATQQGAMIALYAAVNSAGTPLVVQISARTEGAGSDRPFLATKRNADQALKESGIPHVILRPALVIGRNAHGGTALLRSLAALPFALPLAHADNPVETVFVDDVAAAVAAAIDSEILPGADIVLAESRPTTLADLVLQHRSWLGLSPVPVIALPSAIAKPISWLADATGLLGWRSPLRSTAMAIMSEGVIGDRGEQQIWGRRLTTVAEAFAANPSGVQDLWFARLYLLKPLLICGLSLFWLLSGLVPLIDLGAASSHFLPLMTEFPARMLTIATCLLDIALGATVLFRPCARRALLGMVAVSLAYIVGGTAVEPKLWLDPLGPLVKVLPSILLTFAALAILEER